MKHLFVSLAAGLMLYATAAHAQGSEIPENVIRHFQTRYPTAENPDYDKERDGYEVEFRLGGVKWEAYYDTRGNWIRTERDAARTDVPQAVWMTFSHSPYSRWKVDDIEEHQTPQHPQIYEIEVKHRGRKKYLYFLPSGQMIQQKTGIVL